LDLGNVVLQTGKVDPEPYRASHPDWIIIPYSTEFERLIAESSLVVTHQGGGTIFEAVLYNKPLIIVFNPDLTRTADTADIRVLAAKVEAPFLENAEPTALATLIRDAKAQARPNFENGRVKAAEVILETA
jgi:UDP-N-acetylglucosamine:LPS N-acetylglucosamine transferase